MIEVELNPGLKPMRVIAVSGGKGGIGKTTISINLALAFAKLKQKTLLFDADLGLANVDVMLGLQAKNTIYDFMSGKCELKDVLCHGPYDLKVVPATSGIQKMTELNPLESYELIHSFASLSDDIDMMLIDLASGISHQVMELTHASQDILIIINNEPSSLMDSYAVIKILHQKYGRCRFGIIANKVKTSEEGYKVFNNFQTALQQFINVNTQYIGYIPFDEYIQLAARERVAVVDKYPYCKASLAFDTLCEGIFQWQNSAMPQGGVHYFFERLVQSQIYARNAACKV